MVRDSIILWVPLKALSVLSARINYAFAIDPHMASSVCIIMGSKSDMPVAEKAIKVLSELRVPFTVTVASAHRTPDRVKGIVKESDADVFIAIAGLSAALPGVVSALTRRPVIGVPVSGKVNLDAVLSIVQMPPGVPVAAVGLDRGDNAAILAAEILALHDGALAERLRDLRRRWIEKVEEHAIEVEIMSRGGN